MAVSEFASFYPARYGEPFVVEGEGVRVAVRPVGGTDVTAHIDNGQVIYREAYPETDSVHVVSAGRSEEFLFLQNECAPREFAYELSEAERRDARQIGEWRSALYQQGRARGKDRSAVADRSNGRVARGSGALGAWRRVKSGASPRLRLVVAEGLSYPVLIDPSWVTTGSLVTARYRHTATLLPIRQGAGGGRSTIAVVILSSAELYDPATGTWTATGSLGTARYDHTATLLPNGKVLVAGGSQWQ